MKQIDLYSTIEKMLLTKPELRKTENIKRVVWNIYYLMDALEDGKLTLEAYMEAPSMESMTRKLREVKEANGWKDETAKKLENAYHDTYGNPAYAPNTTRKDTEAETQPSSNMSFQEKVEMAKAIAEGRATAEDYGVYPQQLERHVSTTALTEEMGWQEVKNNV
jgi:hypothetical protein